MILWDDVENSIYKGLNYLGNTDESRSNDSIAAMNG